MRVCMSPLLPGKGESRCIEITCTHARLAEWNLFSAVCLIRVLDREINAERNLFPFDKNVTLRLTRLTETLRNYFADCVYLYSRLLTFLDREA